MQTLDLAAKLAVLDEARLRLETELERDEHWRALQSPASARDAELAPEKAARDHRLYRALESNPVFVAWRNVVEAARALGGAPQHAESEIESLFEPSLQEAEARAMDAPKSSAERNSRVNALAQSTAAGIAANAAEEPEATEPSEGLPPEIAALIRAEIESADESSAHAESEQEMHAVGERAARAVDMLLAIPSVAPVAPEQLETARRADRLARELRGIHERRRVRVKATDEEQEIVTQATPVPEAATSGDDVDFLLNPAGAPWEPYDTANDPQERIVTAARAPAAPPARAVPSRDVFLERLRAEETAPSHVPPPLARTRRLTVTEEAEVTLVRPAQDGIITVAQTVDPAPDQTPAAGPKTQRPLRRLINVLTGK